MEDPYSGFEVSESRLLFLPQEQRVFTFFIFQNWKAYWVGFPRIKKLSALGLTSWNTKKTNKQTKKNTRNKKQTTGNIKMEDFSASAFWCPKSEAQSRAGNHIA